MALSGLDSCRHSIETKCNGWAKKSTAMVKHREVVTGYVKAQLRRELRCDGMAEKGNEKPRQSDVMQS